MHRRDDCFYSPTPLISKTLGFCSNGGEGETQGGGGGGGGGGQGWGGGLTVLQPSFLSRLSAIQASSALLQTNFLHVAVGSAGFLRRAAAALVRGSPSPPRRGWCALISSGEAEADILPRSGGALTPWGHPRTRDKVTPVSQLCAHGRNQRVFPSLDEREVIDNKRKQKHKHVCRLLTVFYQKNGYFHMDLRTVACMVHNYT